MTDSGFAESLYEIGSHLIEPNTELDCRNNWLGHKNERLVWERVFDRDDRYNLAKINYIPYLQHRACCLGEAGVGARVRRRR